jgi:hypothetical protein
MRLRIPRPPRVLPVGQPPVVVAGRGVHRVQEVESACTGADRNDDDAIVPLPSSSRARSSHARSTRTSGQEIDTTETAIPVIAPNPYAHSITAHALPNKPLIDQDALPS